VKEAELAGNTVDEEELDRMIAIWEPKVAQMKADLENDIFNITGEAVNVDSPTALLDALHLMGALPPEIDSTEKKVIKDFAKTDPEKGDNIIKKLLNYKGEYKLLTSFLNPIKEKLVCLDGVYKKVYTTFNLVGTLGSRWSAKDPNLQQIPREGGGLKGIFIPQQGNIIVQNDFANLEARCAAFLSQDKNLADACRGDLHKNVSESAFKAFIDAMRGMTKVSEVIDLANSRSILYPIRDTLRIQLEKGELKEDSIEKAEATMRKHLRYCAKAITFGIFFGRGEKALAEQELMCSIDDAKKFVSDYFRRFPDFKLWIDEVHRLVREEGIIITPCGCIKDARGWIDSADHFKRRKALGRGQRQATNILTQGTAGSIQLIAYLGTHRYLKKTGAGWIRGAVHDSTLMEMRYNADLPYHLAEIRRIQEEAFITDIIRFKVDTDLGFSWGTVVDEAKFYQEHAPHLAVVK
jgi:DNA polymerase I-like protein with 3'-5' exonuclease and polymerase domains